MSGLIVNLGIIEATTPVGGGHPQPVDLRAIEPREHKLERDGLMSTHNVPHVRQEHVDLARRPEPPAMPHAHPPPAREPRRDDFAHEPQLVRRSEPLRHALADAHTAHIRNEPPTPPPGHLTPLQVSESEIVRQAREHTFADFDRAPPVPHIDPKAVHITSPAGAQRGVASLVQTHARTELERVVPHVKPDKVPIVLPTDE